MAAIPRAISGASGLPVQIIVVAINDVAVLHPLKVLGLSSSAPNTLSLLFRRRGRRLSLFTLVSG